MAPGVQPEPSAAGRTDRPARSLLPGAKAERNLALRLKRKTMLFSNTWARATHSPSPRAQPTVGRAGWTTARASAASHSSGVTNTFPWTSDRPHVINLHIQLFTYLFLSALIFFLLFSFLLFPRSLVSSFHDYPMTRLEFPPTSVSVGGARRHLRVEEGTAPVPVLCTGDHNFSMECSGC